jgi:predicted adenine nucleotide alpha hydrolase (AANH) superfamily ATPase
MNKELVQFVRNEYAFRKDWLDQAKRMREAAERLDSHDPILATKLRRTAFSIEQLQEHVFSRLQELAMDAIDAKQDEVDNVVSDLFTRLSKGQLRSS